MEEFLSGYFVEGGKWYDAKKNFTPTPPGEEYHYSNTGYALLAYLVEEISGLGFTEYCDTNIFIPLEMDHTAWLLKDTDISMLAFPYEGNQKLPHYSYATYPDGALKTTPTEYAHLLIAMLNDGQYKGKSILQPETIKEMLTPVTRDGKQALTWSYAVLDQMMLVYLDNGNIIGHTGGDPGISTIAVFNQQNKTGLVIFMNQSPKINFKVLNSNFLVKRLLFEAGLVQ